VIRLFKSLVLIILTFLISACSDTGCKVFNNKSLNSSAELVPIKSNIIDMNIGVSKDRIVKIKIATGGVYEEPRKFRVIARADFRSPTRFSTYSFKYDPNDEKYKHLWMQWIPDAGATNRNKYLNLTTYFNIQPKIRVNAGEVVSFKIMEPSDFFKDLVGLNNTEFRDLDGNIYADMYEPVDFITSSGELDNSIIDSYLSPPHFHGGVRHYFYGFLPSNISSVEQPRRSTIITGASRFNGINSPTSGAPVCKDFTETKCLHKFGQGMGLSLSFSQFKHPSSRFIPVTDKITGKTNYFYYLKADSSGDLDFTYRQSLIDMFKITTTTNNYQFKSMAENSPVAYQNDNTNNYNSKTFTFYNNLNSTLAINRDPNRIVMGRYLLELEIGNTTQEETLQKIKNVTKRYIIKNGDTVVAQGDITGDYIEFNSPGDGALFFQTISPYDELKGNLVVTAQAYNGDAGFSNFLNDFIVKPLKQQMLSTSSLMFGTLSSSGGFAFFVKACLTLYIVIYGFVFSLGFVKLTAVDFLIRVTKILLVSLVLSPEGFSFFHTYLFSIFLDSTDYLMKSVSNVSGVSGNIFSFIDPIMQKYLSADLWFILWNYVGFFGYGFIIPGVILMMGVYYIIKALLRVILGYLMAFVALCMMIALGPIFITAILFERTKTYFNNWINVMVGYVIQPTIVLIFVLFIDQITGDILVKGLTPVCYHCFMDIKLYIDIPFPIEIPLFCVNGYAPYPIDIPIIILIRNSFMFFLLARLASSVVDISESVTDMIMGGAAGAPGAVRGGGASSMADRIENTANYMKETIEYRTLKHMPFTDISEKDARRGFVGFAGNKLSTALKRNILGIETEETLKAAENKKLADAKKGSATDFKENAGADLDVNADENSANQASSSSLAQAASDADDFRANLGEDSNKLTDSGEVGQNASSSKVDNSGIVVSGSDVRVDSERSYGAGEVHTSEFGTIHEVDKKVANPSSSEAPHDTESLDSKETSRRTEIKTSDNSAGKAGLEVDSTSSDASIEGGTVGASGQEFIDVRLPESSEEISTASTDHKPQLDIVEKISDSRDGVSDSSSSETAGTQKDNSLTSEEPDAQLTIVDQDSSTATQYTVIEGEGDELKAVEGAEIVEETPNASADAFGRSDTELESSKSSSQDAKSNNESRSEVEGITTAVEQPSKAEDQSSNPQVSAKKASVQEVSVENPKDQQKDLGHAERKPIIGDK
jgi:type IV secretion system protein VirB6